MENEIKACGCVCHRFSGFLLTLIGLDILLGTLGVLDQQVVNIIWPSLLILIGIKKSLPRGLCKCCSAA